MFKRPHHANILQILNGLNHDQLARFSVGFGGGTAVALLLNEYRLSTDIDFLCSDKAGFKELRETFRAPEARRALLGDAIAECREFKIDGYAIRGVIQSGKGKPIKIEFINEARIQLDAFRPALAPTSPILTLSRSDLFAEKLMACDDRGLDASLHSRDIIDLAYMMMAWGPIPSKAKEKVDQAYPMNERFAARHQQARMMLADPDYLRHCLERLAIDEADGAKILNALGVGPVERDQDVLSPYTLAGRSQK